MIICGLLSDVSGVGIFSDSVCMAGTVMLFYSADHCNCEGEQGYCNRYCGRGQLPELIEADLGYPAGRMFLNG